MANTPEKNEKNEESNPTSAKLIRLQISATIAAGLVDNPALSDENVVERAMKLTDKLIARCLNSAD